MASGLLLHVELDAVCEIGAGKSAQQYKKVGLALEGGALAVAVGTGPKIATFGISSIKKVHAKFLDSGKLTL